MRLGKLVPFFVFLAALILFAFAAPVSLAQAQEENQPARFSEFSHTLSVAENTAPGQPVGHPIAATDPDGDSLFFAILNGDSAMFAIDSSTGQLRTRAPLDYEAMGETKEYWFHVAVRDGKGPDGGTDLVADDGALVTIEVEDADDPGTVTLDWSRPFVGTELTATLVSDPDGTPSSIESWQWAWSGSRNGSYTDISNADSANYTPDATDTNRYLRATVTYTDATFGPGKTAQVVSAHPVSPATSARGGTPSFSDGPSTTRSVLENSPPGTNVGARIAATPDGDLLYTLGGDDAGSFTINRATGQIATDATLDYETKTRYSVTVTAANSSGDDDSIDVTISVENEPVEIHGLPLAHSAPPPPPPSRVEYSEGDYVYSTVVAQYTTVPSSADLALTGRDARRFSISSGGSLTFSSAPDYESPRDSGRNNVYNVTINATDGTHRKTHNVRVTVTDYDEGPVATGPGQATLPEEKTGTVARFTARDPESDPIRWYVQDTDDYPFFRINRSGVLSISEPLDFDGRKEAGGIYEVVIVAMSGLNFAADGIRVRVTATDVDDPAFNTRDRALTVAENTPAGTDIGEPVSATDPQSRPIAYSLAGPDAASFAIDSSTGQLRTRAPLDYEIRDSYTVWVRAHNGRFAAHAIVTIRVTDADDPGTVVLSSTHPRVDVLLTPNPPIGTGWLERWGLRARRMGRSGDFLGC